MVTITGRIVGQGAGNNPGETNMIINYQLSEVVNGVMQNEESFPVTLTGTDQEIESILREEVAARVSELTGVSFTSSDVRGCRL